MGLINASLGQGGLPTRQQTVVEASLGEEKLRQGAKDIEGAVQTGFENELKRRQDKRIQRLTDLKVVDGVVKTIAPAMKTIAELTPQKMDGFLEELKDTNPEFDRAFGDLGLAELKAILSPQGNAAFGLDVVITKENVGRIAKKQGVDPSQIVLGPATIGFNEKEGSFIKTREEKGELDKKDKFNIRRSLRQDFSKNKTISDFIFTQETVNKMVSAFDDFFENPEGRDKGVLDESLIFAFKKMIDPGSVVRESEFAQTQAGQALIRRIDGRVRAAKEGGFGLTDETRKELITMAKALLRGAKLMASDIAKETLKEADRAGVGREGILGGLDNIFNLDESVQPETVPEDVANSFIVKDRKEGLTRPPNSFMKIGDKFFKTK